MTIFIMISGDYGRKTPCVTEAFPENSFEQLFWKQQLKALQLKGGRSMR